MATPRTNEQAWQASLLTSAQALEDVAGADRFLMVEDPTKRLSSPPGTPVSTKASTSQSNSSTLDSPPPGEYTHWDTDDEWELREDRQETMSHQWGGQSTQPFDGSFYFHPEVNIMTHLLHWSDGRFDLVPYASFVESRGCANAEQDGAFDGSATTAPELYASPKAGKQRISHNSRVRQEPTSVDIDPKTKAEARKIANDLLAAIRRGGDEKADAVAYFIKVCFWDITGSLAAQYVLGAESEATIIEKAELAKSLRPHVRDALIGRNAMHANYVLVVIINELPVEISCFIVDEVNKKKGLALKATRDRYGYKVLEAIADQLYNVYLPTANLMDEVLTEIDSLCDHSFGSHIVRRIPQNGPPAHKKAVVQALLRQDDLHRYAHHPCASFVIEAALRKSSKEEQTALAEKLAPVCLGTSASGRKVKAALKKTLKDLKKPSCE